MEANAHKSSKVELAREVGKIPRDGSREDEDVLRRAVRKVARLPKVGQLFRRVQSANKMMISAAPISILQRDVRYGKAVAVVFLALGADDPELESAVDDRDAGL